MPILWAPLGVWAREGTMSDKGVPRGIGLTTAHPRTCQVCGTVFEAKKATARYCSSECMHRGNRFGRTVTRVRAE